MTCLWKAREFCRDGLAIKFAGRLLELVQYALRDESHRTPLVRGVIAEGASDLDGFSIRHGFDIGQKSSQRFRVGFEQPLRGGFEITIAIGRFRSVW